MPRIGTATTTPKSSPFGRAHHQTGRGVGVKSDFQRRREAPGPLAVQPGTPGAVQCPTCSTWLPALQGGRPKAHAAGGYGASNLKGRPRCLGSGCLTD